MAGIFNGSSSDLSATVTSTAPDYPILMAGWVKANASTDADTVVALSDNGAGGSLDTLRLAVEGTTVKAYATAAGASSSASQSGLALNQWQFVAAYFESASSRKVKIGTAAWSSPETTSRAVGNYTVASVGSHHAGASANWFNGSIAEVGIWLDFDPDLLDLTVAQLVAQLGEGLHPIEVWHSRAKLFLCQELRGGVNSGPSGYVGPSLAATAVSFDSADKPFASRADVRSRPHPTSEYIWLPWPDSGAGAGPIVGQRIVALGSGGQLELSASDNANWIGWTRDAGSILRDSQKIVTRSSGRPMVLEIGGGSSFAVSDEALLGTDGVAADSGTLTLGIVSRVWSDRVEVIGR